MGSDRRDNLQPDVSIVRFLEHPDTSLTPFGPEHLLLDVTQRLGTNPYT